MNKKKIAIVTGGAGFIGSHMVDLLISRNYKVRVIDNLSGGRKSNLSHLTTHPDFEFFHENICNLKPNSSIFHNSSYVFHFAGIGDIVPSIEKPLEYMSTNVQGTACIMECARFNKVKKVIYAASSSCYGLADTPTQENHKIAPQYPYALSKYLGEQTALHWCKVYGLPVNSIRIFNAYGPRVRTTGAYGAVFGVFFKQKLSGKPFTVVGDGTQSRDFIFVTDIVTAFLAAAESERVGEIYNIGAGNPQSVNCLVKLLEGDVVYVPKRPGEPDCTWADITKIKNHLSWKPQISFAEGVARMVADIEKWQDAPLWNPESIANATKSWFKYMSTNKKGKK
jgi:UDP-glucose 4-epimerase